MALFAQQGVTSPLASAPTGARAVRAKKRKKEMGLQVGALENELGSACSYGELLLAVHIEL
jgi:hypothetical protein